MSEIVPTVTVETPNGPVRINASDYDEKTHGKILEGVAPEPPSEQPVFVPPVPPTTPNFGVVPPVPPVPPPDVPPVPPVPDAPPVPPPADVPPVPPADVPPVPPADVPPVPPVPDATTLPTAVMVQKIGKRWFPVDAAGNKLPGYASAGYAKADDASAAIRP